MIVSSYADFASLLAEREPPCLSLYQPTHRQFPASRENPIRYRNLVDALHDSLGKSHSGATATELIEPLQALQADRALWEHPRDGLAVFAARGFLSVYRVQRPVPELTIVAESFHVKPLVRIVQTTDAYQVLVLDREKIALYEGNRDVLDPVELAPDVPRTIEAALGEQLSEPYTKVGTHRAGPGTPTRHGHGSRKDEVKKDAERFFRVVDKAVLEHHSRPSGLPLVLAALPEHQGLFRQLSRNSQLVEKGVVMNASALAPDELRRAAWTVMESFHHEKTRALAEEFAEALPKRLGSDRLSEVGTAAVNGRIATLLVDAEQHIGGRLNPESGLVEKAELNSPDTDDVLDDIAVSVLRNKGQVNVVPAAQMPTRAGVAAIFRY